MPLAALRPESLSRKRLPYFPAWTVSVIATSLSIIPSPNTMPKSFR